RGLGHVAAALDDVDDHAAVLLSGPRDDARQHVRLPLLVNDGGGGVRPDESYGLAEPAAPAPVAPLSFDGRYFIAHVLGHLQQTGPGRFADARLSAQCPRHGRRGHVGEAGDVTDRHLVAPRVFFLLLTALHIAIPAFPIQIP